MKKINSGLISLVIGVAQIFVTHSFLKSAFGDWALLLLSLVLVIVGTVLAIVSFKKERQNKIIFVMAIAGLILSLSPIIIIFIGVSFFHGSTAPGI